MEETQSDLMARLEKISQTKDEIIDQLMTKNNICEKKLIILQNELSHIKIQYKREKECLTAIINGFKQDQQNCNDIVLTDPKSNQDDKFKTPESHSK